MNWKQVVEDARKLFSFTEYPGETVTLTKEELRIDRTAIAYAAALAVLDAVIDDKEVDLVEDFNKGYCETVGYIVPREHIDALRKEITDADQS